MQPTLLERRQHLDRLKQERARLVASIETAKSVFEKEAATAADWSTPAGLLAHTDKEVDAQRSRVRTAQRDLGKAQQELLDFDRGKGNDLENRSRILAREERMEANAATTGDYKRALRAFLELIHRGKEMETQLARLAEAAGFRRAPVKIFSPEGYNSTAGPVDLFKRDIAEMFPELMAADDPARRLAEATEKNRQTGHYNAAHGYRPAGYVPPVEETGERDSPASRVRRSLSVALADAEA